MRDALKQLVARPIAHRGLHACGAPGPVENSVGAAEAAAAAGFGIECDVGLSRDGEAMVFHDDALARLTGAPGRLGDLDASALRRLLLGGGPDRIPSLPDFLAAVAGRVPVVVEIKSAGDGDMHLAERVLGVAAAYPGPLAIECFDPLVVLHCHGNGAPCPIGLVGPAETGLAPDPRAIAASDFLSWSIDRLAEVSALGTGLPLTTWTVRTPGQVAEAISHEAQIVFEGFRPATHP